MYFNELEFNKAFDLHYTDPIRSKVMLEEYLKKYPYDYGAYPYYISVLISVNEIERARKLYNYIKNEAQKDGRFQKLGRRLRYFEYGLFVNELKLLFLEGRYEDVLYFYNHHKHQFLLDNPALEVNSLIFYCQSLLGMLDKNKRNINCYLYRQITEYQEADFRDHINKHLTIDGVENTCDSVFVEGFPIDLVINEVRNNINPENRIMPGFYEDDYYFKYEECGRVNYHVTHFFKVVVFHGTKDIITMCPCENAENFPYVDLSYLIKKDVGKVKTLSQIEKFRRKYGNI